MSLLAWLDGLAEKFILVAEALILVSIVLVIVKFWGAGLCG